MGIVKKRPHLQTPLGEREREDVTTSSTGNANNNNNPFATINVVDFDNKRHQNIFGEDDIDDSLRRVMGFQGTFRNRTTRFETLREDYAARSRGETTTSNNNNNNAKGGDALEVLGTSRLLEAAIDSTTS